jgi:threonine synthase
VCVLTGHGLKDPTTAIDQAAAVVSCDPEIGPLEAAVLGSS